MNPSRYSSSLTSNENGVCIENNSSSWIHSIDIYQNTGHGVIVGFNSSAFFGVTIYTAMAQRHSCS